MNQPLQWEVPLRWRQSFDRELASCRWHMYWKRNISIRFFNTHRIHVWYNLPTFGWLLFNSVVHVENYTMDPMDHMGYCSSNDNAFLTWGMFREFTHRMVEFNHGHLAPGRMVSCEVCTWHDHDGCWAWRIDGLHCMDLLLLSSSSSGNKGLNGANFRNIERFREDFALTPYILCRENGFCICSYFRFNSIIRKKTPGNSSSSLPHSKSSEALYTVGTLDRGLFEKPTQQRDSGKCWSWNGKFDLKHAKCHRCNDNIW